MNRILALVETSTPQTPKRGVEAHAEKPWRYDAWIKHLSKGVLVVLSPSKLSAGELKQYKMG